MGGKKGYCFNLISINELCINKLHFITCLTPSILSISHQMSPLNKKCFNEKFKNKKNTQNFKELIHLTSTMQLGYLKWEVYIYLEEKPIKLGSM